MDGLTIAAIVPCHNEAAAVGKVIIDLQSAVPDIKIYVYDNCSTDDTTDVARSAGAHVRLESRKGKGNVVRRAFADVDADIYVLVDGDDTYGIDSLPLMIRMLVDGPLDQVTGVRSEATADAYRRGHALGNRFFNAVVRWIFGDQVNDMLSGFRVFSKRFVRSFPALSREFEIETELTIHAINARIPQAEAKVGFRDRAVGTESKLRTYRDGINILGMILRLARHERPLVVHGVFAALLSLVALVLGAPVVIEYLESGLVPRLPTAVLASSLFILAGLVMTIGLMLQGMLQIRREHSRLAYLSWEAVGPVDD